METLKKCEEGNSRARDARLIETQARQNMQEFKETMRAIDARKTTPSKEDSMEQLAHEEEPHIDTGVKLQHAVISKPENFYHLSDTFNRHSGNNVGGSSTYVYLEHTEDIDDIERYEQTRMVGCKK